MAKKLTAKPALRPDPEDSARGAAGRLTRAGRTLTINRDEINAFMAEHRIDYLMLESGQGRLEIRRHALLTAAPAAAPASPAPEAAEPSAAPVPSGHFIKSPMVGTFYGAPSPNSEPFVGVGSKVTPQTTVCIVEAMKVMNEIKASMSGTIKSVLAEPGHPVDLDTPLFEVEP